MHFLWYTETSVLIRANTRSLTVDARSVLQQQGCTGFSHSGNDLGSTTGNLKKYRQRYTTVHRQPFVAIDPTLNAETSHIAFSHNRLFKFEIALTSKINAIRSRADRVKCYVQRVFILTTVPLMLLATVAYTYASAPQTSPLQPITRDITNRYTFSHDPSRFTYSVPLVEASHIAFLAEQGRSIAAYRDTFSQCVHWLQLHPHSWYVYTGNSLLHGSTQYHIGHRSIYIARLDNATHTPYGKSVHKAIIRAEQTERYVWNTAYISGMLFILSVLIESLMLTYVYVERNKVNMVNLERISSTVGRMHSTV